MEVIADPLGGGVPSIDLVFVHGLTRDWQQTWSSDGTSWIQDFLPKDIPQARVFTCGYDVRSLIQEGSSFSDESYALLQGFERDRENDHRSVIFVAHSLGGIILQAFLQRCTSPLRASIKGIVFFSTPNFGLHEKDWEEFAAAISNINYDFLGTSRPSISGHRYTSQLGLISDSFKDWLPDEVFAQNVLCLYELSPVVDNVIIVKKESAVLPDCDATGLCADHIDITKFPAESDLNYQVVMQCIRSMCCLAEDSMRVLLRHSSGPKLHGRLRNLPTTLDGCDEFIVSAKGSPEARSIGRLALINEDQGFYKKAEEKFRKAVELLIASTQCSPEASEIGRFALEPEAQSKSEAIGEKFQRDAKLSEEPQSAGPDDVATYFCLSKLASLLCKRGQYEKAEYYSRRCLNARIRLSGKGSKPTLLIADVLALSMRYQGRHDDAYDLIWDALENANLTTPDTVPHVKLLDTLARLALDCGVNDVAESVSCDAVRRSICLYGEKHPFTLNCMSNLAAILAWTGRISAAEAISRHALDGLEQTLGTDHPHCLKAARRLADYIRFQERYREASLRLKQILKMQEMRNGDRHPDTLSTMRSLGAVYALRGYFKNAETLLDKALSGHEQCFGLEHPYTQWTSKASAKVKELQKERTLVKKKLQQELFQLFGPKSRSTSWSKHRSLAYTRSPFQNSIDGLVFQSVLGVDKENLINTLTQKSVDASILGRALREAAAISQETSLRLLLNYAAPIDAQSAFHGTALQAASFAGDEAAVKLLLERDSVVDQEGGIFGNALRAAVLRRHTAIIRLLLGPGLTKRVSQENLNSSMQLALQTGDVDTIRQLLDAGADVNAEDNLFGSPLQQASFFGQEHIMAMLLDRKANTKMRANVCESSLAAAIHTRNKSAISQLHGAGASVRSSHGKSKNLVIDESHSDSFQYNGVSSRDQYQYLTQPVAYSVESPVPPVKVHHRSDNLVTTTTRPAMKPQFSPISTMRRILTSRSGSGEDGSSKSGSVKERLGTKRYQTSQPSVIEVGSGKKTMS